MSINVPSSDKSFLRLHRAGWSIGDAAVSRRSGLVWLVTGRNGENLIRAEGPSMRPGGRLLGRRGRW